MFAAIYIPDFCLQAVLRSAPDQIGQPVALVDGDASKGTILQLTAAARTHAVSKGMSSAQAMARCGHLLFKSRSVQAERAVTDILLQTAAAFSPNLEDTSLGVCIIDLKGLGFETETESTELTEWTDAGSGNSVNSVNSVESAQQSFGFLEAVPIRSQPKNDSPLYQWAEKIVAALDSVRVRAQVGIAITPEFALLAARAAQPVTVVESVRDFVSALPLESLEPSAPMLELLHRWGIRRVGQFLSLGKDAIAERLGPEGVELFEAALPSAIRPLDVIKPPEIYDEEMEFELPVETLEPLLFVLRRFVEQLATRVSLNYRVISELTLRLRLESGACYEHAFKVPAPTSDVTTLFRMLQTHLENVRTESAIVSLRLAATPSRAENQQFGLFESALRDPNLFHETLARLTALLGADRVGTPVLVQTHRPDTFQMRTPGFDSAQNDRATESVPRQSSAGLALRRFRPPIDAVVQMEQGKPVFISTLLVSGRIRASRGPWRASGDWWDQRRWSRNEWDIELSTGGLYRLFSSDQHWFVEGVYD